tara:strand:- start:166 stop:324 length:159 start_codon:yes stop_codon:yes gene_type:complete
MKVITVNNAQVPRSGVRAFGLKLLSPQCNGSEWGRKSNASFFGTLDVGEPND